MAFGGYTGDGEGRSQSILCLAEFGGSGGWVLTVVLHLAGGSLPRGGTMARGQSWRDGVSQPGISQTHAPHTPTPADAPYPPAQSREQGV